MVKKLDRKLIVLLNSVDEKTREQDLRHIYESCVRKSKEQGKWENGYRFETYIEMGRRLISYNGLNKDTSYFTELELKVRGMGVDVAFLVSSYKDRGLIDEELSWLGFCKDSEDCSSLSFTPSKYISNLEAIKDCSQQEMDKLFSLYTIGKEAYFSEQFPGLYD